MNIVLLEPEKADNCANIGRTCTITGAKLHLIYPLGFQMTRSKIHHAGLDYWDRLEYETYINYEDFIEKNKIDFENKKLYFATTKGHQIYTDINFKDDDFIMFGKESKGIPEEILSKYEKYCIRIPMKKDERSLNLSNSVAIILYEALRQNKFNNLETKGELHNLTYGRD